MAAFNVVRFRVRPGYERQFVETHRELQPRFEGFLRGNLVDTGEGTFCMIGEWRDMASLVAARPEMISVLDALRHMLEDLSEELGATDPVSGTSVLSFPETVPAPKAKTRKKAEKKPKKKKKKTKSKEKKKKKKKKGKNKK